VPLPVGTCYFVNDLTGNELDETLAAHRAVVRRYPRAGDGEDMFLGS
jgi:3-dehydroquinate synthase